MDKAKSGNKKPSNVGAKSVRHATNAGAAHVKGGVSPSGKTGHCGARDMKSGSRGG